jgi:hypothetical protein
MDLSKLNIKSLNSKLSHKMPDGSWMPGLKHMQKGGEPEETIVSEKGYDYKKIYDPSSGTTMYYTKPSRGTNWQDLQNGRNDRALTSVKARVFKDAPIEDWENHPEKADWENQMRSASENKTNPVSWLRNELRKEAEDNLQGVDIDYSKYGVKVVQYPYGGDYGGHVMPPGHIEAQLYDKKTGKLVTDLGKDKNGNKIVSYVNRWSIDEDNAPLIPAHWEDRKDVRVVDLELDPAGIKKFITEAATFTGTDKSNLERNHREIWNTIYDAERSMASDKSEKLIIPTALGTGKKGAYDFSSSNCADGVCSAIGLDDSKYINAGITDPTEVMDRILVNPEWKNVRKNETGARVSPDEGIKRLIKDKTGYDLTDASAKGISEYLNNIDEGTAEKIGFGAYDVYKNYLANSDAYAARDEAFDAVKENSSLLSPQYYGATAADLANKLNYAGQTIGNAYDAYQLIPDGTIPTAIGVAANEGIKYIEDNTDLQFDMEGVGNIPSYWGNKISSAVDYLNPFKDGGNLPKAQFAGQPGPGFGEVDAEESGFGNSMNTDYGLDFDKSNAKRTGKFKGGLDKFANSNGRYSDLTSRYGSYNQWSQSNDKSFRAPIQSAYMPMDLGTRGNVAGAISTLAESSGRLFGRKDKDGDGLMDGAFADTKAKKNRHQARKQLEKSQNYDYKVTADPNDPTKYVNSSLNLYNASEKENPASLQTVDDWNSKLTGDNVYANFDTKTNRYNVGYANPDLMSRNEKLRPSSINDLRKLNKKLDPSKQSALSQLAQDADAFNAADDIPEGTTFGVNKDGESMRYDAGKQTEEDKINYYNKMMMKKFGGHMQEGGQPSPEEMAMMQAQQEQAQQPQQAQAQQEGGGDETVQLMQQIQAALEGGAQPQEVMIQLLQAGMQPETIAQVFVQLGMPEDQIGPAIEQAMTQAQNQQGARPSEEEMMAAQQSQAGAPAPPMMQYGGEEEMSMQFEPNPLSRFMAQDGTEMDAAQFAAEENAYAAAQGYPMAQQMMQGSNSQAGSEGLIQQVLEALSQGVGPEQLYTKIIELGVDQQQAGQIIQQAMAMLNQGELSNEASKDDRYAQMLSQLQDQKNSFKNEYRRNMNELGADSTNNLPTAQEGTSTVTPSLDDPKYTQMLKSFGVMVDYDPIDSTYRVKDYSDPEKIYIGFPELPTYKQLEEASLLDLLPSWWDIQYRQNQQADPYKSDTTKSKKLKRGGSTDSVELTTQQIAKIMAAGGSVKYV